MSTSQMFVVDDMDSGIQYTGPWVPAAGTRIDSSFGYMGPPYNATLHGINTQGGLSFQFTGDSLKAFASIDTYQNSSLNPVWSCFIDGAQKPSASPPDPGSINNWVICDISVPFGSHNFSVTATTQNKYDFWFDQIRYTQPGPSTDGLKGRTLYVNETDPNIHYGPEWQPLLDIAFMTQTNEAAMNFQFNGTSLTWYGLIPNSSYPGNASTATYSVDSQSPTPFSLRGLDDHQRTQYNQIFFKTSQLSPGQHTLQVVNHGNTQTIPLNLDYLVIDTPSPSPSSSSSSAPSNTVSAGNKSSGKHVPTGAIVGGVVGILVVVLLFALAFIHLRRPKKQERGLVDPPISPTAAMPRA